MNEQLLELYEALKDQGLMGEMSPQEFEQSLGDPKNRQDFIDFINESDFSMDSYPDAFNDLQSFDQTFFSPQMDTAPPEQQEPDSMPIQAQETDPEITGDESSTEIPQITDAELNQLENEGAFDEQPIGLGDDYDPSQQVSRPRDQPPGVNTDDIYSQRAEKEVGSVNEPERDITVRFAQTQKNIKQLRRDYEDGIISEDELVFRLEEQTAIFEQQKQELDAFIQQKQQEVDELSKQGELGFWDKRAIVAKNYIKDTVLDLVFLAEAISSGLGADKFTDELVEMRETINNEIAANPLPSKYEGGFTDEYVDYQGVRVFLNENGKFQRAADEEGYTITVDDEFKNNFNKYVEEQGENLEIKTDRDFVRGMHSIEMAAYDLAMLFAGGAGAGKLATRLASKAAQKIVAYGAVGAGVFAQTLRSNYEQDLVQYEGDKEKAMESALLKSSLTSVLALALGGVEALGAKLASGGTKALINEAAKRIMRGELSKGQAAVWLVKNVLKGSGKQVTFETIEENLDVAKDNLIDRVNGLDVPTLLSQDEFVETTIATVVLSLPFGAMEGAAKTANLGYQSAMATAVKDIETLTKIAEDLKENSNIPAQDIDANLKRAKDLRAEMDAAGVDYERDQDLINFYFGVKLDRDDARRRLENIPEELPETIKEEQRELYEEELEKANARLADAYNTVRDEVSKRNTQPEPETEPETPPAEPTTDDTEGTTEEAPTPTEETPTTTEGEQAPAQQPRRRGRQTQIEFDRSQQELPFGQRNEPDTPTQQEPTITEEELSREIGRPVTQEELESLQETWPELEQRPQTEYEKSDNYRVDYEGKVRAQHESGLLFDEQGKLADVNEETTGPTVENGDTFTYKNNTYTFMNGVWQTPRNRIAKDQGGISKAFYNASDNGKLANIARRMAENNTGKKGIASTKRARTTKATKVYKEALSELDKAGMSSLGLNIAQDLASGIRFAKSGLEKFFGKGMLDEQYIKEITARRKDRGTDRSNIDTYAQELSEKWNVSEGVIEEEIARIAGQPGGWRAEVEDIFNSTFQEQIEGIKPTQREGYDSYTENLVTDEDGNVIVDPTLTPPPPTEQAPVRRSQEPAQPTPIEENGIERPTVPPTTKKKISTTEEAQKEAYRQRRAKMIAERESQVTQQTVDKLTKQFKKYKKVLSKIIPGLDVKFYSKQADYENTLTQAGYLGKGFTAGYYNPVTKTIHVNLPFAKDNIIFHEGTHPLMDMIFAVAPELKQQFYSDLVNLASNNPEIQEYLDFGNRYDSESKRQQESIIEFVADVLEGKVSVKELSTVELIKNEIIRVINDLLTRFGIAELITDTTDVALLDFAESLRLAYHNDRALEVWQELFEKMTYSPELSFEDASGNAFSFSKSEFKPIKKYSKLGFGIDNDKKAYTTNRENLWTQFALSRNESKFLSGSNNAQQVIEKIETAYSQLKNDLKYGKKYALDYLTDNFIKGQIKAAEDQGQPLHSINYMRRALTEQNIRESLAERFRGLLIDSYRSWINFLDYSGAASAFKYVLLLDIARYVDVGNSTFKKRTKNSAILPPPVHPIVIRKLYLDSKVTTDRVIAQYANVWEEVNKETIEMFPAEYQNGDGIWLEIPNDPENFADNAARVGGLSQGTAWCTRNSYDAHLKAGPFFYYIVDGKPVIAIKSKNQTDIDEVRGLESGYKPDGSTYEQRVPNKYVDTVKDFLLNRYGDVEANSYIQDFDKRQQILEIEKNGIQTEEDVALVVDGYFGREYKSVDATLDIFNALDEQRQKELVARRFNADPNKVFFHDGLTKLELEDIPEGTEVVYFKTINEDAEFTNNEIVAGTVEQIEKIKSLKGWLQRGKPVYGNDKVPTLRVTIPENYNSNELTLNLSGAVSKIRINRDPSLPPMSLDVNLPNVTSTTEEIAVNGVFDAATINAPKLQDANIISFWKRVPAPPNPYDTSLMPVKLIAPNARDVRMLQIRNSNLLELNTNSGSKFGGYTRHYTPIHLQSNARVSLNGNTLYKTIISASANNVVIDANVHNVEVRQHASAKVQILGKGDFFGLNDANLKIGSNTEHTTISAPNLEALTLTLAPNVHETALIDAPNLKKATLYNVEYNSGYSAFVFDRFVSLENLEAINFKNFGHQDIKNISLHIIGPDRAMGMPKTLKVNNTTAKAGDVERWLYIEQGLATLPDITIGEGDIISDSAPIDRLLISRGATIDAATPLSAPTVRIEKNNRNLIPTTIKIHDTGVNMPDITALGHVEFSTSNRAIDYQVNVPNVPLDKILSIKVSDWSFSTDESNTDTVGLSKRPGKDNQSEITYKGSKGKPVTKKIKDVKKEHDAVRSKMDAYDRANILGEGRGLDFSEQFSEIDLILSDTNLSDEVKIQLIQDLGYARADAERILAKSKKTKKAPAKKKKVAGPRGKLLDGTKFKVKTMFSRILAGDAEESFKSEVRDILDGETVVSQVIPDEMQEAMVGHVIADMGGLSEETITKFVENVDINNIPLNLMSTYINLLGKMANHAQRSDNHELLVKVANSLQDILTPAGRALRQGRTDLLGTLFASAGHISSGSGLEIDILRADMEKLQKKTADGNTIYDSLKKELEKEINPTKKDTENIFKEVKKKPAPRTRKTTIVEKASDSVKTKNLKEKRNALKKRGLDKLKKWSRGKGDTLTAGGDWNLLVEGIVDLMRSYAIDAKLSYQQIRRRVARDLESYFESDSDLEKALKRFEKENPKVVNEIQENSIKNKLLSSLEAEVDPSKKPKRRKPSLESTVVSTLMSQLRKRRVDKKSAISRLKRQFETAEVAKEVVDDVKAELLNKIEDPVKRAEMEVKIDEILHNISQGYVSDKVLRDAIAEGRKELDIVIQDVITKNYTEKAADDLAAEIIRKTGVSGDLANALAEAVKEEFKKQVEDKKRKKLENLYKRRTGKKRAPKREIDAILEELSLGALDTLTYARLFKDKYDLNGISTKDLKRIGKLHEVIMGSADPRRRRAAERALYTIIENQRTPDIIRALDFFFGYYYASILSGLNTVLLAFTGLMFSTLPEVAIRNLIRISEGRYNFHRKEMKKLKDRGIVDSPLKLISGSMISKLVWDVYKTGQTDLRFDDVIRRGTPQYDQWINKVLSSYWPSNFFKQGLTKAVVKTALAPVAVPFFILPTVFVRTLSVIDLIGTQTARDSFALDEAWYMAMEEARLNPDGTTASRSEVKKRAASPDFLKRVRELWGSSMLENIDAQVQREIEEAQSLGELSKKKKDVKGFRQFRTKELLIEARNPEAQKNGLRGVMETLFLNNDVSGALPALISYGLLTPERFRAEESRAIASKIRGRPDAAKRDKIEPSTFWLRVGSLAMVPFRLFFPIVRVPMNIVGRAYHFSGINLLEIGANEIYKKATGKNRDFIKRYSYDIATHKRGAEEVRLGERKRQIMRAAFGMTSSLMLGMMLFDFEEEDGETILKRSNIGIEVHGSGFGNDRQGFFKNTAYSQSYKAGRIQVNKGNKNYTYGFNFMDSPNGILLATFAALDDMIMRYEDVKPIADRAKRKKKEGIQLSAEEKEALRVPKPTLKNAIYNLHMAGLQVMYNAGVEIGINQVSTIMSLMTDTENKYGQPIDPVEQTGARAKFFAQRTSQVLQPNYMKQVTRGIRALLDKPKRFVTQSSNVTQENFWDTYAREAFKNTPLGEWVIDDYDLLYDQYGNVVMEDWSMLIYSDMGAIPEMLDDAIGDGVKYNNRAREILEEMPDLRINSEYAREIGSKNPKDTRALNNYERTPFRNEWKQVYGKLIEEYEDDLKETYNSGPEGIDEAQIILDAIAIEAYATAIPEITGEKSVLEKVIDYKIEQNIIKVSDEEVIYPTPKK